MIELVNFVAGSGERSDAVPYAEKAVALYPASTRALVTLAGLIRWQQKEKALELLDRAVAFEPNDPSMYVARGWCYFWAYGNPVKAEVDFRRAIELSKGANVSAWAGLGDSLARQGRRDEAIAAYNKYLSIRPKSVAHNDGEIRKSIEMLGASAFEIAQIMGWSDIRIAMRYTHATGDGIRRAMQLLTQSKSGTSGRTTVSSEDWTVTKVPHS
jgi:tetratricopeptide (TPR) repeat protein